MPSNQGYQKVATDSLVVVASNNLIMESDGGNGGGHGSGGLPSTHSSQQLMPTDTESVTTTSSGEKGMISRTPSQYNGFGSISARDWFTVSVLCFVNLINYMDRFTIAGELIFSCLKKYIRLETT